MSRRRAGLIRYLALSAATILAAAGLLSVTSAQAQDHRREFERSEYRHDPRWVYDDRYHHGRYYPPYGFSVSILPAGYVGMTYGGRRFFFHEGVWYEPAGRGYVVVAAPRGVAVPVLPPAYTPVAIGASTYYYANGAYYAPGSGGYVVVEPSGSSTPAQQYPAQPYPAQTQPQFQSPQPVAQPYPPQAAPVPAPTSTSQPPGALWYYCESTRAYYPYVPTCKEGWRTVAAAPATPPH